jgi:transcriptional regulator with PAS, ATPase and Fis domain
MPVRVTSNGGLNRGPHFVLASAAMKDVLVLAKRVAAGDAKVLISGESGVGKDLVARYIHAHSPRAHRRFVAVNCAALTDTLLESELFGHVRGSFTGAYRDKIGRLELADRGTVFLDEVGEMSVRMQAMLLRFLENGEIQPVGADIPRTRLDTRVIAATNRNLSDLVASGTFREDLLYRIQVAHIRVPALRHRREDIRPLVEHTVAQSRRSIRFSDDAWEALESYDWPGNVRELQNVVEQLIWMSSAEVIDVQHFPPAMQTTVNRALPVRERRRQPADDLYAGLVAGKFSFWDQIHRMFLDRDITRHDLREVIRRGLTTSGGSYRGLVTLFGMDSGDYKRFFNFIAAHDCGINARAYRLRKPLRAELGAKSPGASSSVGVARVLRDGAA